MTTFLITKHTDTGCFCASGILKPSARGAHLMTDGLHYSFILWTCCSASLDSFCVIWRGFQSPDMISCVSRHHSTVGVDWFCFVKLKPAALRVKDFANRESGFHLLLNNTSWGGWIQFAREIVPKESLHPWAPCGVFGSVFMWTQASGYWPRTGRYLISQMPCNWERQLPLSGKGKATRLTQCCWRAFKQPFLRHRIKAENTNLIHQKWFH